MSKPQSGTWIGMFLFDQTGKAFPVTLDLNVQDGGPITGTFTVTVSAGTGWAGPMSGDLSEGNYLPTLYMALTSGKGNASFEGKCEAPDAAHGFIWGTVTISKNGQTQNGTMSLVYTARSDTALPPTAPADGPFATRIWDP